MLPQWETTGVAGGRNFLNDSRMQDELRGYLKRRASLFSEEAFMRQIKEIVMSFMGGNP